jgi:hypothetical protein
MKTNLFSKSGLFNPRILLAFSLCSVGTLLVMLSFASSPPADNVTVPSTIGQTVTKTWTGTIPVLTNASSDCTVLADSAVADTHTSTIIVPAGVYNTVSAQFTFNIAWTPVTNINTSDEILTVVGVASSDGGNPSETVSAQNLVAGNYKIVACGFTNAQPQPYTGTLTITTSAPTTTTTPPNYTTGAIRFGPATVADFQRTEGEPLLHLDKDAKYWTSGPWGFSTTQSFMHRSVDGGDQFNVVSPTALRPNPPPGGGDTTHAIDDQGFVYFGDLEGALNELDCSVSNDNGNTWKKNAACVPITGTDRQWLAIDNGSNHNINMGGAMDNTVFYAYHDVAAGHLIYSSPGSTGTADVTGGLVFTSAVASPTGLFYSGGGNCGELVFDPVSRRLYYSCSATNHIEVIVSNVLGPMQRTGLTFTTHALPPSPGGSVSNLFPPITVDSAGNVYVVWSDPGDHNLYYAYSTDQGTTWQPTVKVNAPPAKSNVFAWAEAGTAGNLVAIWLGNDSATLSDNMPNFGSNPAGATAFPWFGYISLIRNANTPSPTFEQDRFTEKPMHYGQICNSGIGCTVSMGDRVMADFLSVDFAPDGAIQVMFNDVSSQYHGAHLFLARQLTGPTPIGTTLSKPTPTNPAFDPTGDAQVPHYAPVVGAGANVPQLDLTQASVSQPNATTLRVSMTLNSLSSLLPPPGKANSFWITRFQALSRNDTNVTDVYRVFYVGAESVGGAPPIFFAGSPTRDGPPIGCNQTTPGNCKVVQYPAEITSVTGPVTGTINGNTICVDLPLNAFGATRPIGNPLYNVTAFTGGRNTVLADIYTEGDSTRSFDFTLGNISTGPLLSVVSRKVHGSAGTFDINLPLTGPRGIECRNPGSTGSSGVDYKLIFTFSGPVASCGTASTGSVSSGPASNQCTVNLTSVPNAQYITVTLTGVSVPTACPAAFTGNVSATMGLLIGDVNASTRTDAGDVTLVRQQTPSTPESLPAWDFRRDVNASGRTDAGDVTIVRQHTPSTLPP